MAKRLVLSDSEREKLYDDIDVLFGEVAAIAARAASGERNGGAARRNFRNALLGVILKTLALVQKKLHEQE